MVRPGIEIFNGAAIKYGCSRLKKNSRLKKYFPKKKSQPCRESNPRLRRHGRAYRRDVTPAPYNAGQTDRFYK